MRKKGKEGKTNEGREKRGREGRREGEKESHKLLVIFLKEETKKILGLHFFYARLW